MGINQSSVPKYWLSVRDGSGPDRTDWWTHTAKAYDETVIKRFIATRKYPPTSVYLTPKPAVFSWFTAYPGGSSSGQAVVSELDEMPLTLE